MFQKPKGTEDFYPEEQAVKNRLFEVFRKLCWKYGFSEVETPAFENIDLLTKKSGEEIKDQIFLFKRRTEKEEMGLRFDLTVPVARMFLQKQKELPKPVKWFYTTRMWRYERPQAGRLREFYQMGVEMFGSAYPEADAEVINLAVDTLRALGLTERDFFVKINNRKLLEGLLLKFVDEKKIEAIVKIIDKRAKVKEDEFNNLLVETGIPLKDISKIKKILSADTIEKIEELEKNAIAKEGFEELKKIYNLIDSRFVKIDLSTARGLAYYTGTVFEIFDTKQELRSICGGGRYDNLVELFGGQPTPSTGFAMGLVTLLLLLDKKKLVPEVSLAPDYYVAIVSENIVPQAMKIVAGLRKKYSVETDFLRRNLSKQISYASTIKARNLVVIGENEIKSGKVKVKDLATGNEEEKPISEL
ncbi:histidine--tRNA ligase [Candidatus Woesearchaeota archaeon]|nr:histidine--tRNA ligase [Candidatus Woesearchaeota archaeon]